MIYREEVLYALCGIFEAPWLIKSRRIHVVGLHSLRSGSVVVLASEGRPWRWDCKSQISKEVSSIRSTIPGIFKDSNAHSDHSLKRSVLLPCVLPAFSI